MLESCCYGVINCLDKDKILQGGNDFISLVQTLKAMFDQWVELGLLTVMPDMVADLVLTVLFESRIAEVNQDANS